MCGIAGYFRYDGGPTEPTVIAGMTRSLAHRGPDGAGEYFGTGVALGHTRLAILDLDGGAQPMCTPDERFWIVFNGEIFNYRELRTELERHGETFRTTSDTEVLLRLYRAQGPACVHGLNGQWAFAVWDAGERRLFLSRDRLGVRPLFYAALNRCFVFGSEVKTVLSHPQVPRRLNERALDEVFTFWSPLSPRTMFEDVQELPPGHSMTVGAGGPRLQRYWQLRFSSVADAGVSLSSASDRLTEILTDSTRLRLNADVPVGAYLSGGLDSTMVAALAHRTNGDDLQTFSVAFDDPDLDERQYQSLAAAELGTRHHTLVCRPADIGEVFPDVVYHAEAPLLRTAPAPLLLLSRFVRDMGCRVVLTGEGSDELLGGYDIFKEQKVRRYCQAMPGSPRRALLFRRLYPYLSALHAGADRYTQAFFGAYASNLSDPLYSHRPRWALTAHVKRFYSPDFRDRSATWQPDAVLADSLPEDFATWEPLSQAQYLEATTLLPGYILSSQGDRMAMAHGVEGRFPFLDVRLVEFAASLPPRLRLRALNDKPVLRHAAAGLVPERIRRRRKQPYRAPDAASFFTPAGRLLDYAEAMLSPAQILGDGIFDAGAVTRLVAKARERGTLGVRDSMALVGIVSTGLLLELVARGDKYDRRTPGSATVRCRQLPVRPA